MVDNQECRTVTDEKCSTVQEKQCSTVNEQVSKYIMNYKTLFTSEKELASAF